MDVKKKGNSRKTKRKQPENLPQKPKTKPWPSQNEKLVTKNKAPEAPRHHR